MDGACFKTYLSLCRPFRFEEGAELLDVDPAAFRGPADPLEALQQLLSCHSLEELTGHGLVQLQSDGQPAIHPLLDEPYVVFVALRHPEQESVTNLMTGGGCVSPSSWPLFAVFEDKPTLVALDALWPTVLLTGTIEDAIWLRSFGLAAAPIAGLSELDDSGFDRLGEIYGADRRPSEREDEEAPDEDEAAISDDPAEGDGTSNSSSSALPFPITQHNRRGDDAGMALTLVRWTPHKSSPAEPASVSRTIRHLKDLHRFRGLDISEIHTW